MLYAIIESGGKQYKVTEGSEILIDKLSQEKDSEVVLDRVLLIRSDNEILVGTPYLEKGKVLGKLLENIKGEKIKVKKFKAKVRYRRTIGFRPVYSKVLIEKIVLNSAPIKRRKSPREKKD